MGREKSFSVRGEQMLMRRCRAKGLNWRAQNIAREHMEDELTNFVKALIKQLKISPEEFISFLKVMSLSEYGNAHFKVGELEMLVYRGFGGLSFEVKWYQQGVKRSIEYDLTRLSSIVKLMSRIKEGEEQVANP